MAPSTKALLDAGDSDDDLDSGAPEAVSRAQSTAESKRRAAALEAGDAERRRKRKDTNKRRDENLKRRAAATRAAYPARDNSEEQGAQEETGSDEEGGDSVEEAARSTLEGRMERAMREAEQEDAEDGNLQDDAWEGIGEDESMEEIHEEENVSVATEVVKTNVSLKSKAKAPDYLPEYLFSEALSKSYLPVPRTDSQSKASKARDNKSKRRKRNFSAPKDVILGSKAIRVTNEKKSAPEIKAASRTVPAGKVRRFAEARLQLKSDRRSNRWQRKPSETALQKFGLKLG